jgi:hypothetical protein
MDLELGRTRVHEHAETGKPLAAYKLHTMRSCPGAFRSWFGSAERPCKRQGWNGPAGVFGTVGHKLSAIGLPYRKASSASSQEMFAQFAAPNGRRQRGLRQAGNRRVIPSAHPQSSRILASPFALAVGPGSQTPPGGKVRWQRKFASQARRTKRGLQF